MKYPICQFVVSDLLTFFCFQAYHIYSYKTVLCVHRFKKRSFSSTCQTKGKLTSNEMYPGKKDRKSKNLS